MGRTAILRRTSRSGTRSRSRTRIPRGVRERRRESCTVTRTGTMRRTAILRRTQRSGTRSRSRTRIPRGSGSGEENRVRLRGRVRWGARRFSDVHREAVPVPVLVHEFPGGGGGCPLLVVKFLVGEPKETQSLRSFLRGQPQIDEFRTAEYRSHAGLFYASDLHDSKLMIRQSAVFSHSLPSTPTPLIFASRENNLAILASWRLKLFLKKRFLTQRTQRPRRTISISIF